MSQARRVAEGLWILAKYSDDVAAEHDCIYAGHSMRNEVIMRMHDAERLNELGWRIGDADRWQFDL